MIGFSINLADDTKLAKDYMSLMVSAGFTEVYTTIDEPDVAGEELLEKLKQISAICRDLGLALVLGTTLKAIEDVHLKIEARVLAEMGISGIRLPKKIENKKIAEITKYINVGISASHADYRDVEEIISLGGNKERLEAWFNFYEKLESGISDDFLTKTVKRWKSIGIRTVAFAPGDEDIIERESRVTLERHRAAHPLAATLELLGEMGVDRVYIGDSPLKEKTITQFKEFIKNKLILLYADPIDNEYFHLVEGRHINRRDEALMVVQAEDRFIDKEQEIVDRFLISRPKGSLTLDNIKNGRYMGEFNICKVDLPLSRKVNVIGHIRERDLDLLKRIKGGDYFFVAKNEF